MATQSVLRFGAQTDEVTSLLRIVNLVRSGEAVTRPEIGRLTGLGRGVITQRIDLAIEHGFLEEGKVGASTGGRAPRTLRFRAEQALLVVIALGALHINVGLAHLDADVIDHAHRDWDIAAGPEQTIATAIEMAEKLLAKHPALPVWAVAVGVPGPVDFASGRPVVPPIMPGWDGYDLRGAFSDQWRAPVWVDNDVNLLAHGELARRRSSAALDLVYCKVGTGIGAGLVSAGRVHRGQNGAAGDIGHARMGGSDATCRCGKTGCLEAVAGGWAIVRDATAALAAGETGRLADYQAEGRALTPELVTKAAEDGDRLAIRLVTASAAVVGEALATLVNMFNPGIIVIGGAVAAAGELYLAEVRGRIQELSLPLATRDLEIVNSVDDVREPLRGGLELLREQLFDVTFPRWFADSRPTLAAVSGTAPEGARGPAAPHSR